MASNFDIEEAVLDQDALDRNTMGNVELQHELFILFFDQMPAYLGQMNDALQSADDDDWSMAAHGIKGSARALGFTRIARLALESEKSDPDEAKLRALKEAIDVANDAVSMNTALAS